MPPASPQNQQDDHLAPIWITAICFAGLLIAWFFLRAPLIRLFFQLKLIEIDIFSLFFPSLLATRNMILTADPATIPMPEVIKIANSVGSYLAPIAATCLLVFAYFLYKKSITLRFRRTYNMKVLLKLESVNWPQTTPVVDLDLAKEDIDTGVWGMSKTPMQFAKMHKMLKEQKKAAEEGALSRSSRIDVILNKAKATDIFVKQLGRPWTGIDALNMHTKALFAVFAARANGEVEVARKLLSQIAASSATKQLNFTGVRELLDKYRDSKIVKEVTSRHAFVLPMMATMLELARTVGVQASADFLWLKPIDRRLWYVLNSVGRQTPFVEAAGPFAHWLVEKKLARKVMTPMVEEAVKALDEAIQSVIYKPDEE